MGAKHKTVSQRSLVPISLGGKLTPLPTAGRWRPRDHKGVQPRGLRPDSGPPFSRHASASRPKMRRFAPERRDGAPSNVKAVTIRRTALRALVSAEDIAPTSLQ